MSSDTQALLYALAEIRRHQIVATKANPATDDLYSDAYVHAVLHSICPAFHEDPDPLGLPPERFPFSVTYEISRETVLEVAQLLDARWMANEEITFRDVEKVYGHRDWPGTHVRNDLVNICRYFWLQRMFDGGDFWRKFLTDAPNEALGIARDWDREELLMWTP